MHRVWLVALSALSLCAQTAIDWSKQKPEILERYRDLIKIDSRAGNETKAAKYIRHILEAEGIAAKVYAKDPARANLVARIRGNGSKRPLLILAQADVVGVQPEKWPVDPFGAVMKDG